MCGGEGMWCRLRSLDRGHTGIGKKRGRLSTLGHSGSGETGTCEEKDRACLQPSSYVLEPAREAHVLTLDSEHPAHGLPWSSRCKRRHSRRNWVIALTRLGALDETMSSYAGLRMNASAMISNSMVRIFTCSTSCPTDLSHSFQRSPVTIIFFHQVAGGGRGRRGCTCGEFDAS